MKELKSQKILSFIKEVSMLGINDYQMWEYLYELMTKPLSIRQLNGIIGNGDGVGDELFNLCLKHEVVERDRIAHDLYFLTNFGNKVYKKYYHQSEYLEVKRRHSINRFNDTLLKERNKGNLTMELTPELQEQLQALKPKEELSREEIILNSLSTFNEDTLNTIISHLHSLTIKKDSLFRIYPDSNICNMVLGMGLVRHGDNPELTELGLTVLQHYSHKVTELTIAKKMKVLKFEPELGEFKIGETFKVMVPSTGEVEIWRVRKDFKVSATKEGYRIDTDLSELRGSYGSVGIPICVTLTELYYYIIIHELGCFVSGDIKANELTEELHSRLEFTRKCWIRGLFFNYSYKVGEVFTLFINGIEFYFRTKKEFKVEFIQDDLYIVHFTRFNRPYKEECLSNLQTTAAIRLYDIAELLNEVPKSAVDDEVFRNEFEFYTDNDYSFKEE